MGDDDIDSLTTGNCPDCGQTRWYLGPRGGASRNIECAHCGERFNVLMRLQHSLLMPLHRIPRGERTGAFWERRPVQLIEPEEG